MGIFGFNKKEQAAWNALVGSYTFFKLDLSSKHSVHAHLHKLVTDAGLDLAQIMESKGFIVAGQFMVYALSECGIPPAIDRSSWFHIRNPFVDCIGSELVLSTIKLQLERKYGVQIDTDE